LLNFIDNHTQADLFAMHLMLGAGFRFMCHLVLLHKAQARAQDCGDMLRMKFFFKGRNEWKMKRNFCKTEKKLKRLQILKFGK
jgi:hypothetical protein